MGDAKIDPLLDDGADVTVGRLLAHGWVGEGIAVSSGRVAPSITYLTSDCGYASRWTFDDGTDDGEDGPKTGWVIIPPPKTMADLYALERLLLKGELHNRPLGD